MEVRLINGNELYGIESLLNTEIVQNSPEASFLMTQVLHDIQSMPTIDPETLPIVQELREQLERVTQERDAAVEQLRGDCEKCAYYKVTWNGCTPDFECPLSDRCLNRDMWEWRGPQKED